MRERGSRLGTITDEQLQFLIDQLEEESTTDRDYYLTSATIDMLEEDGADALHVALLRQAIVSHEDVEVRWEREDDPDDSRRIGSSLHCVRGPEPITFMPDRAHPLDDLVGGVPILERWWRERQSEQPLLDDWTLLVQRIVSRSESGCLPELPPIATVLEKLLADGDEDDLIELGFIEPLLWAADEHPLNVAFIRASLGPRARDMWDAFSRWYRQQDLRKVELTAHCLGDFPAAPLEFVSWLRERGTWVDAGTAIGTFGGGGDRYELRTLHRCYLDRFASVPGHSVRDGDLLLYIAVENPAVPRDVPLCSLAAAPPSAPDGRRG